MSLFEVYDPAFGAYVLGNAPVKRLATGFDWVEGPVWFGDLQCLLFSDIPSNRILRWTEDGVTTFRSPSNYANGHARDRQGRLVSCENGTRRVTRTGWDGTVTVVADGFDGKPLNSPNDVIAARDGNLWFSDLHLRDHDQLRSISGGAGTSLRGLPGGPLGQDRAGDHRHGLPERSGLQP